MRSRLLNSDRIRNFTFGVEDSLVSTAGLVSGIAAVDTPRSIILLTGTVLIFVEAFSMSVGSLLSDNSAREFEKGAGVPLSVSFVSSMVMFVSYFFSGFIVLAPYVFFENSQALPLSIVMSLISLFALGIANARVTHASQIQKGAIMATIGGIAIFAGIIVGQFVNSL